MTRFAAFDTPIGACAIAWRGETVALTALPARSGENLLDHVRRRLPEVESSALAPPIRAVVDRILRHLGGEPVTYDDVAVAFGDASIFERSVWTATSTIPAGETRTYGQIAAAMGEPGAARAVGRALGRNPVPIIVPCHRVLAADGRSGGFTAPGGVSTKLKLLDIERARRGDQPSLFDDLGWAARR